MVIIEVRTNRGVVGRCDAKCHNATEPECRCICGGALHGVGVKVALEDRRYLSDDEIIEACKTLQPSEKYHIYKPQAQKTLFGDPEPSGKKPLDNSTDS